MSLQPSKPDFQIVYNYATGRVSYYIQSMASSYPKELKKDITQYCLLEVWKAYERLDEEAGTWKSFISKRCLGAVKDFIRGGHGYEESKWSHKILENEKLKDVDPEEAKVPDYAIKSRLTTVESDLERNEHNSDVEKIAGVKGVFHAPEEFMEVGRVNFELLSRLASKDDSVLLVAKWLIGFSITDMSEMSGVTRERFSQKLREFFFEILDDPCRQGDKYWDQVIYALGLSDIYGTPNFDAGEGWDYEPVDIYKEEIIFDGRKYSPQLTLFPEEERQVAS